MAVTNRDNLYFYLNSDTKFSIRLLITICVFIIAVFGFELKMTILGLHAGDSQDRWSLAWFSLCLIILHGLIAGTYFWRDRKQMDEKRKTVEHDLWEVQDQIHKKDDEVKSLSRNIKNREKYKAQEIKDMKQKQEGLEYKKKELNAELQQLLNIKRDQKYTVIWLNGGLPLLLAVIAFACLVTRVCVSL